MAQLTPYRSSADTKKQFQAWDRLMATLESGIPLGGETFARDELYDL